MTRQGGAFPAGPVGLSAAGTEIRRVTTPAEAELFIRLPALLGGAAAGWSVPLFADTRRIFDSGFNTALAEWTVPRWLAWRDGRPVGRIAAAWPRDGAATAGLGSFGFLALERDPAVLAALLDTAAGWLAERGATRLRGPFSFTINHEIGLLVEGGALPMPRMPRNPAWLPPMLDALGLAREKDVLACTLDTATESHRAAFAPRLAAWSGRGELRIRPLRRRGLGREVALIRDMFNDAWAGNWGALPVSAAEAGTMKRLLRPMLLAGGGYFAEWRGEPIGLAMLLPNVEAATARLDGRLLPLGWARMLRALIDGQGSARLPMFGIRRAWRGTEAGRMAAGALLAAAIGHAERRGWRRVEISWILEDHRGMLRLMDSLPAPVTGRWRIWGAPLPLAANRGVIASTD